LIVCQRPGRSVAEAFAQYITMPIQLVAPKLLTVKVETLAKAIINNTIYEKSGEKIQTFENETLHQLAGLDERVEKNST
jgi:hypothetical protein